jgi:serine/threonine protein kinase
MIGSATWPFDRRIEYASESEESERTSHGYEFMNLIGSGSQADVFRVRQRDTGVEYAAKVFPGMRQSAKAELCALSTLKHENILHLCDHFECERGYVLIFELCRGGTLESDMKNAMGRERFLEIARQMIAALAECHRLGLAHRDIKPGNVLLANAERTEVRLADFGLAEHGVATGRAYVGSPSFMAPEQLEVGGEVDPFPCDVWSLGVVFAFMLLGRHPFGEDQARQAERIQRCEFDRIPDGELQAVIGQMLAPLEERVSLLVLARNPLFAVRGQTPTGIPAPSLMETAVLAEWEPTQSTADCCCCEFCHVAVAGLCSGRLETCAVK